MTVHVSHVDQSVGRPVAPTHTVLRSLGMGEARVTGGFWLERQQVNGRATLDHNRFWLHKLGWIGNFNPTPGQTGSPDRRGREFTDSEVYKLLEAMSWEVGRTGDAELDREITELTALIAGAQAPDGYVNTAFGRPGQRPRYSDLASGHELYCTGHMIQAAVARTRTRGADQLLEVARRAADQVCETFGTGATPGICGHPEIETALVELFRVTGEQRYLDQAQLFIARRGHRTLPPHHFGWSYYSDDIPVRDATVLRGHAVRSLYLACGAVDVAVETGDTELLAAVAAQFDRTLARRTYLTGGMGSRHTDEAFGDDHMLPADRAYSETCAGIAAIMLAWRLQLATGELRYGDIIERILYNVVAAAISDDGRSFFYAQTLHQRTRTELVPVDEEQLGFGGGPRAPWFEVSCCLANIGRMLASLEGYLVTADADGLQLHQFADLDVTTRLGDGRSVGMQVRTRYPDDGVITVRITETSADPWSLAVRIPAWAGEAVIVDGAERRTVSGGVAVVRRVFAVGDEIRWELPMRPRWTAPDPRIDAVRGCVAVERGPVVLCAESVDQLAGEIDGLLVDAAQPPQDAGDTVTVSGSFVPAVDTGWPYGPIDSTRAAQPLGPVRLVPYHRWARRGPSTMRVWLPSS